ncbi:MAG TPA: hypothetical protein VMV69_26875 [Pirellulales bacterium]|nr:hypothetical protein [Pirellulales bacterium]
MSRDPADRDYLRSAADDPIANAGAGMPQLRRLRCPMMSDAGLRHLRGLVLSGTRCRSAG